MELSGKVLKVYPAQMGQGKKGTWRKQEFIIETKEQYPKKVCLSLWGDKFNDSSVSVGDEITASLNIESREYNGRWYTEVRVWKLTVSGNDNTPDWAK